MDLLLETPIDLARKVAGDFRKLRKSRRVTIKTLSEKSGVSYASIKRFEHSGEISFVSLIKLASVLNFEAPIRELFENAPPQTIEEILRGNNQ